MLSCASTASRSASDASFATITASLAAMAASLSAPAASWSVMAASQLGNSSIRDGGILLCSGGDENVLGGAILGVDRGVPA